MRLIYYYFQINSILDLPDISEYYYFNENNYIPKHTSNLNGKIDLIDLNSIGNLYAKNNKNNEKIAILYDDIYYKLFFYQYYYYRGKFYGFNESNNYIILNENIYSKIYSNKPLRYELSEEERKNNGAHIRIRIGIFNNIRQSISELQEFNFFICLEGYQFCDIETSMKCLKEGYYQMNNKYYSCYETCKKCDTYPKENTVDYFKNYCDECKEEYSFYIIIIENEKEYKSCYNKCPPHAPI